METHLKVKIIFLVGLMFLIYSSVQLVGADLKKINNIVNNGAVAMVKIGRSEIRAEMATTDPEREKGLSNRGSLESDAGMVFIYDKPLQPSFWMKGVLFPIDIIWVYNSKVVETTTNIPVAGSSTQLPTYSPRVNVDTVIEVNAGWVDNNGIRVGDRVKID
ncbi:MAG: DUF192 domain-containing protein [Patescibacteria group bacterium]